MKLLCCFLVFASSCIAEEYHFVSINNLVEQEVGRIVLPQIYEQMDIEITIKPLPGKRAQYEATSGISDGEIMRIFTYGIENPTVHRVPTPYYQLETMAFIQKDSNIIINNKDDLAKYKIAKVRGVKHTNNITKGLDTFDFNSTEQALRFVEKGRADIALTNTTDGLMTLKRFHIKNVMPIESPLATLELFHYIHADHKSLVPRVDAKIKEMKLNGELAQIIEIAENAIFNN